MESGDKECNNNRVAISKKEEKNKIPQIKINESGLVTKSVKPNTHKKDVKEKTLFECTWEIVITDKENQKTRKQHSTSNSTPTVPKIEFMSDEDNVLQDKCESKAQDNGKQDKRQFAVDGQENTSNRKDVKDLLLQNDDKMVTISKGNFKPRAEISTTVCTKIVPKRGAECVDDNGLQDKHESRPQDDINQNRRQSFADAKVNILEKANTENTNVSAIDQSNLIQYAHESYKPKNETEKINHSNSISENNEHRRMPSKEDRLIRLMKRDSNIPQIGADTGDDGKHTNGNKTMVEPDNTLTTKIVKPDDPSIATTDDSRADNNPTNENIDHSNNDFNNKFETSEIRSSKHIKSTDWNNKTNPNESKVCVQDDVRKASIDAEQGNSNQIDTVETNYIMSNEVRTPNRQHHSPNTTLNKNCSIEENALQRRNTMEIEIDKIELYNKKRIKKRTGEDTESPEMIYEKDPDIETESPEMIYEKDPDIETDSPENVNKRDPYIDADTLERFTTLEQLKKEFSVYSSDKYFSVYSSVKFNAALMKEMYEAFKKSKGGENLNHKGAQSSQREKFDIVIIFAESDSNSVARYKKHLENDLGIDNVKVGYYDSVLPANQSCLRGIEEMFDATAYIFIYVTTNFTLDDVVIYQTEIALNSALHPHRRQRSRVVPVWVEKDCTYDHQFLLPNHGSKYYQVRDMQRINHHHPYVVHLRTLIVEGRLRY